MPIDVITGQPGNGKTLLMMERLEAESRKTAEQGRRVLVACGIDGLAPGIADIVLDDPRRWNDKDPVTGEYLVPDGSLVCVDESWKWFGHLHDARQAPTPSHVLALAEHRHRGLDFIWTTQMANQLYPFVRGLIGSHTHVVRKFGTKLAELFTWGELCEDVKSQGMRDKALTKAWILPFEKIGKLYKSATTHTIKARLPWRLILIPGCIIVGLVLMFWAYSVLKPDSMVERLNKDGEAASGLPAAAAGAEGAPGKMSLVTPTTAAEWEVFLKPVVPGVAFTAPAFAGQLELTTHPQTLCVISGADDGGDTCHCYTEQVTPVAVADAQCRNIAIKRYYDPYKPVPEPAVVQPVEPGLASSDAETIATAKAGP